LQQRMQRTRTLSTFSFHISLRSLTESLVMTVSFFVSFRHGCMKSAGHS
jgi:hypothetical protein